MSLATNPEPHPGVHRLKLPLAGSPLKYVNAYLLAAPQGYLLIDTGWNTPDCRSSLLQQLDGLGIRPERIGRVVITHAHIDHYGLAAGVLTAPDSRLLMHALEADVAHLRYGDTAHYLQRTQALLRAAGAERAMIADGGRQADRFAHLVDRAAPDILLQGGETLQHGDFSLEVIWTPGHSPGHICLYEPTRKLFFSGDHLLPGITPTIGRYPRSGDNPLGDYIASVRRLRSLNVALMLPGHGPPMTGFRSRIDQVLSQHERRTGELLQRMAACAEPLTAYDLARIMPWSAKLRPIAFEEMAPFDQRLAVASVSAHLAALVHEGRLIQQTHGGVHRYQPVRSEG
ncbi:MBL fold metallo-hydrolase [Desulfatitalea alkaliphila]|uniref:MBL fold metallo-hydrolase n=1 Tax=Desulfatitalea alkaliphila TaxID=2929485 RepID=A0AA41QZY0_9BACT|nr:MBL fold metallo-hydrolase [Desulfatitalea alkaliphila]MCJ8499489.1 MBL fold metallo-hydrolase [Desulfatitalea alkaliphila]